MTKRRVIPRVVVLLLLGAIVNVAVAWGCAIRPAHARSGSTKHFERTGSPIAKAQTWIWMRVGEIRITQINGTRNSWWVDNGPSYIDEHKYRQLVPYWSIFDEHEPALEMQQIADRPCSITFEESGFGWPMFALMHLTKSWEYFPSSAYERDSTALDLSRVLAKSQWPKKWRTNVPIALVWPGFAINTIFYAAMLWVAFLVPGKLKQLLRRRRGLCPACAYPIGASAICCECGAPVSPARLPIQ